jgi:hypothetical protein
MNVYGESQISLFCEQETQPIAKGAEEEGCLVKKVLFCASS